MPEREPHYTSGSYLATLVCCIVLFYVVTAHFKQSWRLPFQIPTFHPTPDERPVALDPVSAQYRQGLAAGMPLYLKVITDHPSDGRFGYVGPKDKDGNTIPRYVFGTDVVQTGFDDRGHATWRARRPDEVLNSNPWSARPYETAMDYSKGLADSIRDINSRLTGGKPPNP